MSCRQKGKHRSRHHTHAVRAASLPSWKLPPLALPEESTAAVNSPSPKAATTPKQAVAA